METTVQPLHVGAAVALGLALIGFLVGTGAPPQVDHLLGATPADATTDAPALAEAPTYRTLRSGVLSLGTGWEEDTRDMRGPSVLDSVETGGADKVAAVAARSSRRAYDGAPPTIPHTIRQDSAAECLACHDEGLRLRGRIAAPMSHTEMTSCTQCHVVEVGPMPGARLSEQAVASPNSFVGLASPVSGERAWGTAPSIVPHSTTNRERCDSCHGVNGRDALRTPHPDRQSCTQCHALSAQLDRRPDLWASEQRPGGSAP
jgi:nitrate reductase (cytochrome), electron transfer subunit